MEKLAQKQHQQAQQHHSVSNKNNASSSGGGGSRALNSKSKQQQPNQQQQQPAQLPLLVDHPSTYPKCMMGDSGVIPTAAAAPSFDYAAGYGSIYSGQPRLMSLGEHELNNYSLASTYDELINRQQQQQQQQQLEKLKEQSDEEEDESSSEDGTQPMKRMRTNFSENFYLTEDEQQASFNKPPPSALFDTEVDRKLAEKDKR